MSGLCSWIHSNVLNRNLLKLIIRCQLSCVNDRISHNVWHDTNPETERTLISNNFRVAVHRTSVRTLCRRKTTLCLHSNFNYISWVCNRNTNCTSCHTSCDLLEQSWVLARGEGTADHVSHWYIQTNTETSKHKLSLETRHKSVPKG